MLRVARRIGDELGISVRTTFLGAHALPPEFAGRADDYIDAVCDMAAAPACAKAWSMRSMRSASASASRRRRRGACSKRRARSGLPVKLHADQLSDLRRRGAGRGIRRPVGRPCRTHQRSRRARDGASRHRRGAAAGRLPLSCAKPKLPPLDAFRAARRADGGRDRLQSRHLAAAVAAPGDAAGLHAFPADAGGSAARRDRARRARARLARSRHPARRACAPTSCIGTSRHPAELCYWLGGRWPRRVYAGGCVPVGSGITASFHPEIACMRLTFALFLVCRVAAERPRLRRAAPRGASALAHDAIDRRYAHRRARAN